MVSVAIAYHMTVDDASATCRATYGATEKRPGGARSVYYDDICENEFSDEKKRGSVKQRRS